MPDRPDRPDRPHGGYEEYEEHFEEEYSEEYEEWERSHRQGRTREEFRDRSRNRTEVVVSRPAAPSRRVVAAPVAPPKESVLPKTGAEVTGLALLGTALVGGGVLLATRRRTRRQSYHY